MSGIPSHGRKDGPGNYVDPLTADIVDHTFTVFDHRTEGEIHINKRDLDLRASEENNTAYDAYADENGDGTLEGAVYGLFASTECRASGRTIPERFIRKTICWQSPQPTGMVTHPL